MKMLQSYQQQQGIPCVHEESMLATGALAIAIGDKSAARAHPDAKDQSGSTNGIRSGNMHPEPNLECNKPRTPIVHGKPLLGAKSQNRCNHHRDGQAIEN